MKPHQCVTLAAVMAVVCLLTSCLTPHFKRQSTTLYSPVRYKDESRGTLRFDDGRVGVRAAWDLEYGALYAGDDYDWFAPSTIGDNRGVIRDLGFLTWSERFRVPVVTPRPQLQPGERRVITVDTSAGKYKNWAENNGIFVRAVVGHMYVMRVMNSASDFYILFRVENLEHGDNCTISWRRVHNPK